MTDDAPEERLHKLAEEFHRFVNNESLLMQKDGMELEELTAKFGLSISQAKAWLKKEPNYTNRRIFTEEKGRRGLDRTMLKRVLLLSQ
jgi:hypothetical protein